MCICEFAQTKRILEIKRFKLDNYDATPCPAYVFWEKYDITKCLFEFCNIGLVLGWRRKNENMVVTDRF